MSTICVTKNWRYDPQNTKTLPKNYPWNVVLSLRRVQFARSESNSKVPYQAAITMRLISHRRDGQLHIKRKNNTPQGPKWASFTSVQTAKVAVEKTTQPQTLEDFPTI